MTESYHVFSGIEETIYFWTRNDSSIISGVLTGDIGEAYKRAEAAIMDNKAVLHEYAVGIRKAGSCFGDPLDYKMINSLKKRVFDNLSDDERKSRILQVAKSDILNIIYAMKPIKSKTMLYRSEWTDDTRAYKTGDTREFNDISSTCITPYKEDTEYAFYRYEICVPESVPVLELDRFECHNEDGEVLLPPMICRVKHVRTSDNARCKGIIELDYMEGLPVNI